MLDALRKAAIQKAQCRKSRHIQMSLSNGVSLAAHLVGADAPGELAMMHVSINATVTVTMRGDSSKVRVGSDRKCW